MMRILTIFCCNFKWTDSRGKAFIESKRFIAQGPVLCQFSPQFPIIPQVDVSSVGVGGRFLQNDQSVVFYSNILQATKQCSAVTENESVANLKYLDFNSELEQFALWKFRYQYKRTNRHSKVSSRNLSFLKHQTWRCVAHTQGNFFRALCI